MKRQVLLCTGFVLAFLLAGGISEGFGQTRWEGNWAIDENKEKVECENLPASSLPPDLLRTAEERLKEDFGEVSVSKHKKRFVFEYEITRGASKEVLWVVDRPRQRSGNLLKMKRFHHPIDLYGSELTLRITAEVSYESGDNSLLVVAKVKVRNFKDARFRCSFRYVPLQSTP